MKISDFIKNSENRELALKIIDDHFPLSSDTYDLFLDLYEGRLIKEESPHLT